MFKNLLFLAALGLALARPNDEASPMSFYEPHDDCPPAEVHFLLPHEYDCTKFYYCEYGLKWIEPRSCAPGTEFNAATQGCVHPVDSGCHLPGPGGSSTQAPTTSQVPTTTTTTQAPTTTTTTTTQAPTTTTTTTTPAPTTTTTTTTPAPTTTTTTTTTTTPAPTTTTTTTTPAPTTTTTTTTAAPTTTTTTQAPTTTTTTQAPTTTTTTQAPTTTTTTTQAPTTTTTTQAPTTTTQASTTTQQTSSVGPSSTSRPDCDFLDNGCPADFDVHWLLPHEEYCNKFYYCDKGQLVERFCAPGTVFSPIVGVCVHPVDFDCGDKSIADQPDGPIDDNNKPCNGTDNDIGEVLENGCPANFDVHHLLPHETDCDKFYYCVHGQKVVSPCAPGTHFNYEIQACDWPYNVNCVPGGGDNDDDNDPDNEDDSDSESVEINDPEDNGFVPLPNGCPADFSIHHLLPHESDCSKFYYCVHGQKVVSSCAPGTHFNPVLQVCDWPHNAGCEQSSNCPGGNNCPGDDDKPGCNGNCPEDDDKPGCNGNCPEDDDKPGCNGNCPGDDDDNGFVPLPNGCPSDFDIHHLLPHESDCSKFYYCVHGQKVVSSCGPGTHFNPVLQVCDWPANAGCEHWNPDGPVCDGNCPGDDDKPGCNGNCPEDDDKPGCNGNCPEDDDKPGCNGNCPEDDDKPGCNGNCPEDDDKPGCNGNCPEDDDKPGCNGNCPEDDDKPGCNGNCPEDDDKPGCNGNCPEDDDKPGCNGNCPEDDDKPGCNGNCPEDDDKPGCNGNCPEDDDKPGCNGNCPEDDDKPGCNGNCPEDDDKPGCNGNCPEDDDKPGCNGNCPGDDDPVCDGNCPGGDDPVTDNPCANQCNVAPWASDDCDKYWMCVGDKKVQITCSEGLHFNPTTLTCDFHCNSGCERKKLELTEHYDGVRIFLPWNQLNSETKRLLSLEEL